MIGKSVNIIKSLTCSILLLAVICMVSCADGSYDNQIKTEESLRVDSLLSVADVYFGNDDVVNALSIQTQAYTISKSEQDRANVEIEIARCHFYGNNLMMAHKFVEQALKFYDKPLSQKNKSLMNSKLRALNLYAMILEKEGEKKEAIRQYSRAASLARSLGNINAYINTQMIVLKNESDVGNYASAIDGYRVLLRYCPRTTMPVERFMVLNRLHNVFLSIGNSHEAADYLYEMRGLIDKSDEYNSYLVAVAELLQHNNETRQDSVKIEDCVSRLRKYVENVDMIRSADYNAMGLIAEYYIKHEKHDSAQIYAHKFCKVLAEQQFEADPHLLCYANIIHAQSHIRDAQRDTARMLLFDKELINNCNRYIDVLPRYYELLSEYYYQSGDYKKSYRYISRMTDIVDSIKNEVLSHNFAYRDMAHHRDTIILSNNIKINQKQSELESLAFWQKIWVFIIVVTIVLAISVALNVLLDVLKEREKILCQQNLRLQHEVVRQTSVLQSQKIELEKTNEKLNREIEYASRIQHDILPPEDRLQSSALKGHFVFYRPCSHISGDFYWFRQVGTKLLIVCADATGHGIPGAFVAMVCSTILNDITASLSDVSSVSLLTELDRNMRNILLNNVNTHGNDSVDLSVVCIDNVTKKVTIALSRHYAYIVRNDGTLETIAGVKRSIGDLDEAFVAREFVEHECFFDDGDMIYLTTDGLESQFGGPEGKKLKRKRMTDLFVSLAQQSPSSQGRFLDNYFNNWKQDYEQTDDVLVIGLCFNKNDISLP